MAALGGETDLNFRVRKRVAEQVFQQLHHPEHGDDDIRIMRFMSNVYTAPKQESYAGKRTEFKLSFNIAHTNYFRVVQPQVVRGPTN